MLENEVISELSPEEQTWFDALINDSRVMLTPHIAGWTFESKEKIAAVLAAKIKKVLAAVH